MFEICDVVLASTNYYRITNSNNPCVVTINKDCNSIFNIGLQFRDDIVVSPLITSKKSRFPVCSNYFKKIKTIDSKYGFNKGDQVILRDVCENILNVPKGTVGEIFSFVDDEGAIDEFGEIVVLFPTLEKYEIIRKSYIKYLTTL